MRVRFVKDSPRQYSVVALRSDGVALTMRPAPGFDEDLPHDLQHFIVEAELRLGDATFGQLAAGGDAGTFWRRDGSGKRASRLRKKLKRSGATARQRGRAASEQSERATIVAWHRWLASSLDAQRKARAADIADWARSTFALMDTQEQRALEAAMPGIQQQMDACSKRWRQTAIGDHMELCWRVSA